MHNGDVQPSGTNRPRRFSGRVAARVWRARRASCGRKKSFRLANRIQVATARGSHPFPSRTGQLSPAAPMVLPQGGRVGRRRLWKEAPFSWQQHQGRGTFLFCFVSFPRQPHVLLRILSGRAFHASMGRRGWEEGGIPHCLPQLSCLSVALYRALEYSMWLNSKIT